MISYQEIETESAGAGVPPQTLEKDYHLDWYLTALCAEKMFQKFSFYGGTALKKLYLANHRFSEDIDLVSGERLSPQTIGVVLSRAHEFLQTEANLFYSYRPEDIQISGTQTRFLIHYRGFSEIGGMKRFLLDIAQGIEELPDAVSRRLVTPYRDLAGRNVRIRAWPLEVICADKLALIVDRRRKEPRDVYDLWSVLTQVKKFDSRIFFSRFRKVLSYSVEFPIIRASLEDSEFQRAWETRLKHQVPHLPDFKGVVGELADKLQQVLGRNSDR
jgi:uncharacterized protein